MQKFISISLLILGNCFLSNISFAQKGVNDTLRVAAIEDNGKIYPIILLEEFTKIGKMMDAEEAKRRNKLKNDVFAVYPYALAAAAMFKEMQTNLDKIPDRRDRKRYLKTMDKKLNTCFKQPLKNLTIDQGRILIKLVDRQTGQNCYSIIRELKSGIEAVMWETASVFFNDNISKRYDPTGDDADIEGTVRDIEESYLYKYELYQQQQLLSKVQKDR